MLPKTQTVVTSRIRYKVSPSRPIDGTLAFGGTAEFFTNANENGGMRAMARALLYALTQALPHP